MLGEGKGGSCCREGNRGKQGGDTPVRGEEQRGGWGRERNNSPRGEQVSILSDAGGSIANIDGKRSLDFQMSQWELGT